MAAKQKRELQQSLNFECATPGCSIITSTWAWQTSMVATGPVTQELGAEESGPHFVNTLRLLLNLHATPVSALSLHSDHAINQTSTCQIEFSLQLVTFTVPFNWFNGAAGAVSNFKLLHLPRGNGGTDHRSGATSSICASCYPYFAPVPGIRNLTELLSLANV